VFRKTVEVDRGLLDKHLRASLGEPFATMTERVAKTVDVDAYSFVDCPEAGQGTLVSLGLAGYARAMKFATDDGYAQELMITVDQPFFGDALLEFFTKSLWVYAKQRTLLTWGLPMTLAEPVPGSAGMRALLPTPSNVVQVCTEPGGVTMFCRLVPIREEEAFWLRKHPPAELIAKFKERQADLADLTRDSVVA
jgi:suppressor of fused protein SUFU